MFNHYHFIVLFLVFVFSYHFCIYVLRLICIFRLLSFMSLFLRVSLLFVFFVFVSYFYISPSLPTFLFFIFALVLFIFSVSFSSYPSSELSSSQLMCCFRCTAFLLFFLLCFFVLLSLYCFLFFLFSSFVIFSSFPRSFFFVLSSFYASYSLRYHHVYFYVFFILLFARFLICVFCLISSS